MFNRNMLSFLKFKGSFGLRLTAVNCTSKERIDGKTVIITGGNTGIGKETAIDLAKRGGRIVICCRSEERAEKAVSDIKASSQSENVTWYLMDLMSLESVRKCCFELLDKEARIDILINNAGIMMAPFSKSVDGIESHMATNHFGHFLFTLLLLPKIKQSENARIINVTSVGYQYGKIDFETMNESKGYDPTKAYGDSKLANILFTRRLAEKLKNTNIRVFCVHPGIVDSELIRYVQTNAFIYYTSALFMKLIAKTCEQGAQTTIHCAVSKSVDDSNGLYFAECKVEPYTALAMDDTVAEKLWNLSISVVGLDGFQI